MNLIALVDKKWGIANKGRELVDIPEVRSCSVKKLMEKLLLWEERH